MIDEEFDVIIVGSGPAGSSTATFLARTGRKVLLVDRARFPRDKTCGDGISGRSIKILNELGLLDQFYNVEHVEMYGVTFSSPKGTVVPVSSPKQKNDIPSGFVCRREVFDNVLFQNAKRMCTKTLEGFFVKDVIIENGFVKGIVGTYEDKEMAFKARLVVGADGCGGPISRKLGTYNDSEEHQCVAVRTYYENVAGMTNQIELHFVKEALPGYFWVFPLPNEKANVGIGMLVRDAKAKKINLQKVMFDIIQNNPLFKDRFKNSKRVSEVKSWMLPLGSRRMKIYGNGYILVGDAASLIDPFTGEGIGNALTSGKIAAMVIDKAFKANDFSEKTLSEYSKTLFADVGSELKTDYDLQKMANNTFLLNLIIDRAQKSGYVQSAISNALINPDGHRTLKDPFFIFKALFF